MGTEEGRAVNRKVAMTVASNEGEAEKYKWDRRKQEAKEQAESVKKAIVCEHE